MAGQILVLAVLLSLGWGLMAHSHAFGLNWGAENALEKELVGPDGQFTGFPLIGGTRHTGLQGLEPEVAADEQEYPLRRRRDSIPHMLFMFFQMIVAVVAPVPLLVLLSDRLKGGPLIIALLGWSALVYVPLAHWIWGFGWLRAIGVQDYAGGAVLHMAHQVVNLKIAKIEAFLGVIQAVIDMIGSGDAPHVQHMVAEVIMTLEIMKGLNSLVKETFNEFFVNKSLTVEC
jgi:Amt family ammonium transporter